MSTATTFDSYLDRVSRGERFSPAEIRELAKTPDILSLGMLADTLRRQMHGARATFVRVADVPLDDSAMTVPQAAREVRLTGVAADLDAAVSSVEKARRIAGDRVLSGFSWTDIARWSGSGSVDPVLARLKNAGLNAVADLALDTIEAPAVAVKSLKDAGFERLRLTISKASADVRTDLLLLAAELQQVHGNIQALNPLPLTLSAFRPTTGYEDVKMVALARLAAPNIPSIQVDWRRYGPKLAQVALTFGADDIDGISPSDDAPEGRRRAARAEIERNIQVAGFSAVERDGSFNLL
jgi:aminodeoxyfutalosine synthase